MNTYIKKSSFRTMVNAILRIAQRIEVTKLSTRIVTIKSVYKNKQLIEVKCNSLPRCTSKI